MEVERVHDFVHFSVVGSPIRSECHENFIIALCIIYSINHLMEFPKVLELVQMKIIT
jgi:hypothetical protein